MKNGIGLYYFYCRCLLLFFLTCNTFVYANSATQTDYQADQSFFKLANEYIDNVYFKDNPTLATIAGIHHFDDQIEDYSKVGIHQRLKRLQQYEAYFSAVRANHLSEEAEGDLELILNHIRSERLTLERIRPWENNPDFYSSNIANAALVLIERRFASSDVRLKNVIAREKQMPMILQAAQKNLQHPIKIYTQIALQQLPDIIKFFQNDINMSFKDVSDVKLKKEFKESNAAVIQSLLTYQGWLKKHVLPNAQSDFRLGAEIFRKKLLYDEMIDMPLDQLLAMGMQDLRQNQAEFKRIAQDIDPEKSPMQVLNTLENKHPSANELLANFENTFTGLVQFIKVNHIISIPTNIRPILSETPPFLRATMSVTIDTPGPFESKANEAYFNVTLPDPTWSKKKITEYMQQFNYPLINNIAIHTAYPGHYVQLLWLHTIKDRVRKIFGANSNEEGWALYCEQMMLDEGFTQNNLQHHHELRLAELHDALLRDARYIVSIQIQTGKMTMQQGIDFFIKEAYQPYMVADKEVKRSAMDPMYLTYTLGKLEILKLRADLKAKLGAAFNLEQFHNQFMQQGFPPIKIVRRALLHDDSKVL